MKNRRSCLIIIEAFFLFVASVLFPLGIIGQEIHVTNTSRYTGSGRYDWKVHLVATEDVLNRIEFVEYTLHPAYSDPVRRIHDKTSGFALSASGWSEFNIEVCVVYKDGHRDYMDQRLSLRSGEEQPMFFQMETSQTHDIHGANTSRKLDRNRWEWTVFIQSDETTLAQVACVEYTLHSTFPEPVQRICQRGEDPEQAFPLTATGWGTFTIGVQVIFKNSEILYLEHPLFFMAGDSNTLFLSGKMVEQMNLASLSFVPNS